VIFKIILVLTFMLKVAEILFFNEFWMTSAQTGSQIFKIFSISETTLQAGSNELGFIAVHLLHTHTPFAIL